MNPLAVLLTISNAVFTLLITLALKTAGITEFGTRFRVQAAR